jgi:hypothetical protein
VADAPAEALVCPSCGARYGPDERFCAACKLPLTYPAAAHEHDAVSERHRLARKIKPQLAEGQLVRVVGARNQAEGEFIQSMLLEEGIPSVLRRSAGFDVPDYGAGGPRDVLVPESGVPAARDALLEAELISTEPAAPVVAPVNLLLGLLAALAVGAVIVWALSLLH